VIIVSGCASTRSDTPGQDPSADDAQASDDVIGGADEALDCVTGLVVPEGVEVGPRTWIEPEDADPVEVVGPLVANVRLLTGTTARVCGPAGASAGSMDVTTVSLVEVDGLPAALGRLRQLDVSWQLDPLEGGTPLDLVGVPEGLARAADRVVWVAGELDRNRVTVRAFGVLEGWR
jgi:hypothetical protein